MAAKQERGTGMLIDTYELEILTPPCEPGAERFVARARLKVDIMEVLPFLNRTLRGAVYHPAAGALIWKKSGHSVAFHRHEIAVSNVEDRQAAADELRSLVDLVNRTWERRAEIVPDSEPHQRPTAMALYQLLPKTNCKDCGEPTCFTFALKLAAAQVRLEDCRPLLEPAHAEDLAALRSMVIEAVGTGPKQT